MWRKSGLVGPTRDGDHFVRWINEMYCASKLRWKIDIICEGCIVVWIYMKRAVIQFRDSYRCPYYSAHTWWSFSILCIAWIYPLHTCLEIFQQFVGSRTKVLSDFCYPCKLHTHRCKCTEVSIARNLFNLLHVEILINSYQVSYLGYMHTGKGERWKLIHVCLEPLESFVILAFTFVVFNTKRIIHINFRLSQWALQSRVCNKVIDQWSLVSLQAHSSSVHTRSHSIDLLS